MDIINFNKEKILLLGGAGFIGHNLAIELKKKNADVLILDSLNINNITNIISDFSLNEDKKKIYLSFLMQRFELLKKNNISLEVFDIRNFIDLLSCIKNFKPSKIVNLAAISSALIANNLPTLSYDIQINGTRNLVDICRTLSNDIKQIVFFSSSTIYGDFDGDIVNETTRPKPKGVYANAKYIGERLVREAKSLYNIDYTIVRPSALYGERCISGRVSQKFIENALENKPLILEGGGDGLLDFTHIDDLVDGVVLCLYNKSALSKTFNITYGNARKISELADIIKNLIPKVKIQEVERSKLKPKRGTLSIERAKQLLNYTPKRDLRTGYRKYCEWYINQWNNKKI